MSLPSQIHFLLDGEIVNTEPCNIGWYVFEEGIAKTIHDTLSDMEPMPDNVYFDTFELYGYRVTFQDFKQYGLGEITHEELMSRYEVLDVELNNFGKPTGQ